MASLGRSGPRPPQGSYTLFAQPPQTPQTMAQRSSSEMSPRQVSGPPPSQSFPAYPVPPERVSSLQSHSGDVPIQARPHLPDASIQPIYSTFSAVNTEASTSPYRQVPEAFRPGVDRRGGRKRGRPSKAEQEVRLAQAHARGEVYPPPKRQKNPKISTASAATGEEGEGAEPKSKTARKLDNPMSGTVMASAGPVTEQQSASVQHGERRTSEEEQRRQGDLMEVDTPESQRRSEAQSEQAPSRSLLPGVRELAGELSENRRPPEIYQRQTSAPVQTDPMPSRVNIKQESASRADER